MSRKLPPKDKQFKKGESGNPKGRPVGSFSLTRAVKEYLLEQSKDGETYGEKLKKAAVLRAIGKSDVLMKEIWDRTDGKVVQDTNLNVTMPTPLLDNIRKDDRANRPAEATEDGGQV